VAARLGEAGAGDSVSAAGTWQVLLKLSLNILLLVLVEMAFKGRLLPVLLPPLLIIPGQLALS
jgi:hypothetical protein